MDFLAKPVDPDHLLLLVSRALEQRRIVTENLLLKEELAVRRGAPQLVGEDPSLRKVFASLQRAAATDATVLIEGESGTGKELFARSLHALSPRADAPFVAINCAAIPENLLETELFGYEKGAFTGAVARKPGKFEMAHRGTLFLDEIGDLPLTLQAKILRALEEKRFERVGGTASVQVDVRLVAATNKGLRAAVAARRFREDLYFRLSVFPITVPPLRDRPGDIPVLARYFVERFCRDMKKKPLALSPGALEAAPDVSLAGQRARAAELHRARGDPGRRRHDARRGISTCRSPQPLRTRTRRRRGRTSTCRARWRTSAAASAAEVGADQDRGSAEGGRRQQGARRGAAADRLQDAAREAAGARDRVATPASRSPSQRRGDLVLRSRPITTSHSPMAVGST